MKTFYTLAIAVVAVIGLALFATPASAVHKGAGPMSCGACHTMHNTQGNVALDGGTPTARLLRSNATNEHGFCLMCHAQDGSQATINQSPTNAQTPKVLTAEAWVTNTTDGFSTIAAGGDFRGAAGACGTGPTWACTDGGASLGRGHSLGEATSIPPGGDTTMVITCVSCHDPHGTDSNLNTSINIFRNLRFSPIGQGTNVITLANRDLNADGGIAPNADYTASWKGSTKGTFVAAPSAYTNVTLLVTGAQVWPISDSTPSNSADSNQYTATGGNSSSRGISGFCAACHDNWHETVATANISGASWTRHPVDYIVNSGDASANSVATIDWTNYATTTPTANRVPMAHNDGYQTTGQAYMGNANNQDKVFCLSCHFAHGGPYFDTLRWDYVSAVGAGTQTANAAINTAGCQQCHLR